MVHNEHELLPMIPEASAKRNNGVRKLDRPRGGSGRHRTASLVNWLTSFFEEKPYKVTESLGATIWHVFKRLITLCILVGAVVLGIAQQSFDITTQNVWQKIQVNEDAQLALFGLLNTLLALMVRDSLSHITDTIITQWMISNHGASSLDFEMYEETIKPWKAVANIHTRRKQHGWSLRDGVRFTTYVVVGVCLLLQGASMNTIGMSKLPWWPDGRFANLQDASDERLYLTKPATKVATVNYASVWEQGFQAVQKGGLVSWEMAHAFGAMSTLAAFESIHSTFSQPASWTIASDQASLVRNAMNVTNTSTPSIQAIAIHGGKIVSMWDGRENSSNSAIRRAHGWVAYLNLNGILLDTACYEQSKAPINQWIVLGEINRDKPDYSIDDYGQNRYPPISRLPGSDSDKDIAKQLADWFSAILPNLELLSSNNDVANLTSIVSRLANVVVELNRGHTRMDGLAIVLSVIFSNLLTTFTWIGEEIPGNTTRHGPVRWQVYGSGPRVPWQWAAAAVLGVSIVVQIVDIFYIFCRKAKGPWLSLGGMLVAANAATRMAAVTDEQGAGVLSDKDKFAKYYSRQDMNADKPTMVDETQVDTEPTRYGKLGRN